MKNLVVFSGAGISAESGLKTFRDSDGLWEEYDIMEVATPEAWQRNPELVLEFYNKRRKQVIETKPNAGHLALAELENHFNVEIITQNIDNLHERAGSGKVLHLHGEVTKARSTVNDELLYDIKGWELNSGDLCELGSQLRPHVVWFGEAVPNMENAHELAKTADLLLIIGTSLNVYPAAGLIHYAPPRCKKFLIDPSEVKLWDIENLKVYRETAAAGVPKIAKMLLQEFGQPA